MRKRRFGFAGAIAVTIAAGSAAAGRAAAPRGPASSSSAPRHVPLADTAPAKSAAWPDSALTGACRARLDALRRQTNQKLADGLDVPFVVAGDLTAGDLARIQRYTIRPAAEALWKHYFDRRPTEPITILLFSGQKSYKEYAERLFADKRLPHFGYYRSKDRTLVMNIDTGTGTLVHEMVHALADFDFPEMPTWFSEGLASLYEQCTLADGDIRGLVNWRLPALQEAIRGGRLRPLKELITSDDFRGEQEGMNYAQARYFCMYMQSGGVLRTFYRSFRENQKTDPNGLTTVRKVFGGASIERIDRDFTQWVRTLQRE